MAPAPAAVPSSMTADKQTAVVLVMSFLMMVGFILLPPFFIVVFRLTYFVENIKKKSSFSVNFILFKRIGKRLKKHFPMK
jgi:hypothetical protein